MVFRFGSTFHRALRMAAPFKDCLSCRQTHGCSPTDYQRELQTNDCIDQVTPQHLSNTGHIPFFTLAMIPKNKMSHLQLFHLNYSMAMPFIPIQSIKTLPAVTFDRPNR